MAAVHGNRGKCAQGCRLPYELLENSSIIDKGYLLSPKDVCSLELLPQLISAGVTSFKIEGRMKTPEYVAVVTKIYRKYIDKVLDKENYVIDNNDILELKQVFNRGGFSTGHLDDKPNTNIIFKEKPNNMGIYIGDVIKYNPNKKYVELKLKQSVELGDSVSFSNENSKYNVSELMSGIKNIPSATSGNTVTIGRMIGNIRPGDKVYKMSSKSLSTITENSYMNIENKKIKLDCKMIIKENSPISVKVTAINSLFFNPTVEIISDIIPVKAVNQPISKEKIINQFSKTTSTPFEFNSFDIDLDDDLFVSPISLLNELRRNVLSQIENDIINSYQHHQKEISFDTTSTSITNCVLDQSKKISLLLNNLNKNLNYNNLNKNIDRLYIPLKCFLSDDYKNILDTLTQHFTTYIYMPSIMKKNYTSLFQNKISKILDSYKISGFVISNIGQLELLKDLKDKYEYIGNYTLNLFNNKTALYLGLKNLTISPELNKQEINLLCNSLARESIESELIVYGNLPLMTSNYCLLGKSNKCYETCDRKCNNLNTKYYLKDRMGFLFRIIPDNTQTITTIYNSKTTSIDFNDINSACVRIDILDENINEINQIIETIQMQKRFEGEQFTNGNINRLV